MADQPVFESIEISPRAFFVSFEGNSLSPRKLGLLMRRARKAMASGDADFLATVPFLRNPKRALYGRVPIPPRMRRAILARDGAACIDCFSKDDLQMDHITPVVFGGATSEANLCTRCRRCNLKKGPKPWARRHGQ